MEILLFSNDDFLINFFKLKYDFINLKDNKKDYNIIIFDNYKELFINKYINNINFDNKLIINIGNTNIEKLNNFIVPFRILDLYKVVENFKNYCLNNIFIYSCGVLNINKKHFTNKNNKIIFFTDKEIELLKFLISNKKTTKEKLLENLWDTKVQNIRLVDNIVYNLKQKFLSIEVCDFILNINGIYYINPALTF